MTDNIEIITKKKVYGYKDANGTRFIRATSAHVAVCHVAGCTISQLTRSQLGASIVAGELLAVEDAIES